ncbi:hypothetical protein NDU88_007113 [Pleurodeles waltl]|uniref:Uncharacterized protein n=1 Tax=Pleurodeles waltl TaxID=8319 RepID=A0AAV7PKE2_PLEWA|nr:hypothetical protein NDU88_007113 [Pleurodeles waltl]
MRFTRKRNITQDIARLCNVCSWAKAEDAMLQQLRWQDQGLLLAYGVAQGRPMLLDVKRLGYRVMVCVRVVELTAKDGGSVAEQLRTVLQFILPIRVLPLA